ncbi:hypothetical protein BOX15_Mlig015597g1 [Macrostomum lignano]|uniref:CX domain-containing protein n=2 Tax=Macrostomum lignano TaxID=282301 RepID=A0A267G5D2_9PLAT|nr:hypothetical protein BOX15_Mlig015597g1 [Macrostomum lignano]
MPPHLPLLLLLSVTAIAAAAPLASTKPAALAVPALGIAESNGLNTMLNAEKELESVELCSSSEDPKTVIQRQDGGKLSVKNIKQTKLALVNFTESLMAENYCCSSKAGVRCTFKYKPVYYVLCIFTGLSSGLLLLLGLLALFYKYKYRPWEFFRDLMSRPLLPRSGLSIRSDGPHGEAREADTAVDSVVDCSQRTRPGQLSSQCQDDRILPDIF